MTAILTRDLLMNFLMGLAALVILTLVAINPASTEQQLTPPGNLIASITWPAGDEDVDLWVSYADDFAVGYSNKSATIWSLLRDDLGNKNDLSGLNFESAFSRGLPDGEYAVNVRCYSCTKLPMPVSIEVRLAEGGTVWSGVVDIMKSGQERTAIRFRVADGAVVADSANQVFKQMKRKS
ncbi:hypothetical protein HFO15_19910 [Rhizobium laguerreae]|uniref:hypothetical protein n=1 Tax=Rhizobium laguerreae TaxID=1076926 RepID=UPI001C91EA47|nr:hypothetical protein [Rhizobium laguerreae]MBY3263894.1 hypothetical protein [Rhizobium laguerreae]